MATKEKSANEKIGPPSGLWFTKAFPEGNENESRRCKRRMIERYFEGFLRGYNVCHGSTFEITEFVWSIDSEGPPRVHRLEVYITPPPIQVPPATTDPPNPSHPPPKMTIDVGQDPKNAKDILSNA